MLIIHKFCIKKYICKPVHAMNVSSVTELEVMGIVPDDRFHTCAESVDFNCDIDTMQHMLNSSVSQFITTQNKTASSVHKYIPFTAITKEISSV